jgi:hypothetical protein
MSDTKLTLWQGPPLTELAPLQNSISNELSYDGITYTPISRQEMRDIISEGRDVRVSGTTLSNRQRLTLLDALAYCSESEGCKISLADIDSARRSILEGR